MNETWSIAGVLFVLLLFPFDYWLVKKQGKTKNGLFFQHPKGTARITIDGKNGWPRLKIGGVVVPEVREFTLTARADDVVRLNVDMFFKTEDVVVIDADVLINLTPLDFEKVSSFEVKHLDNERGSITTIKRL